MYFWAYHCNHGRISWVDDVPNLSLRCFVNLESLVIKLHILPLQILVPPIVAPASRWSWDPEEERRRQEKWQKEQERLLQVHKGKHS